jgi:hypothetical protein
MKITGFDHFQITMPKGEEAKAREFYAGLLGLTEIPKPPNLAKRGGVWFRVGSQQLHVSVEEDFRPVRKGHPAFLVTELAKCRKTAKERGYAPYDDTELLEGYNRFFLTDPFGNRLEFLEPIA